MQIWWNKRYFKANLVILKIIYKTVENIEQLLIKMANFHMHHFLDTLYRNQRLDPT